MTVRRYENYKDSGVAWLGEVPAHWNVRRLKFMAVVQTGIAKGKDYTGTPTIEVPFLRVANVQDGYLDLSDVASIEVPAHDLPRYRLQAGDVLMNEGGDFDKLGRGHIWDGSIDPCLHQNHVFAVRPFGASSSWLNLISGSRYAQFYFMSRSKQSTNLASISSTNVMELPVVMPPAAEQCSIIDFLDRETAKIDALVEEQQRLIELLKEKRRAVISHAVTKGLNPNAPMKDSGVEWLGEVPAHWRIAPLGRVATERCDGPFGSGIKSSHYTDDGALVVRLQNIRSGRFNMGEPVYLDAEYFLSDLAGHAVAGGDVLIAGLGDENNLLGRACVAPPNLGPALVKADCFRFRLDTRMYPEFIAQQLSAGAAFDAGQLATGTTRSRIPLGTMASRKVAYPPREEQEAIIEKLNERLAALDELTSEADAAVVLLQERRTALVSAAITGKIDVRGLAPAPCI